MGQKVHVSTGKAERPAGKATLMSFVPTRAKTSEPRHRSRDRLGLAGNKTREKQRSGQICHCLA